VSLQEGRMREVDYGNGWKAREIPKEKGFGRDTLYYYKGRLAPRIQLTSHLAQQLAGFTLIDKDLRNVLAWLSEIDVLFPKSERPTTPTIASDRKRFNVVKGLYVASVAFYAKCFTQCEGRRAQLNRTNLDEDYRELHDEIMRQRHNYVAHSGADRFEEVQIALVLAPTKTSSEAPRLWKELFQPDLIVTDEGEKTFEDLVKHAQTKALAKMAGLNEKIMQEDVLPKGKDYWYKKSR
jgi:hypothetical protein